MRRRDFLRTAAGWAGGLPLLGRQSGDGLDVTHAVVVAPLTLSRREQAAVRLLVEEVAVRSGVRWPVIHEPVRGASAVVSIISGAGRPGREGYTLRTLRRGRQAVIELAGADERGLLFAVGGLVRRLRIRDRQLQIADGLAVSTAPRYALRGHQLGYRNLPNTYDGWSPAQFERYIRDLALFGTNAIEFIPPYADSSEFRSVNFTLPPRQMLIETSKICDRYGLDVWLWYPALGGPYSEPRKVEADLKAWGEIFASLPRLDAVFVPGGDPGNTPPRVLMPFLEKQAANLRRSHPDAEMWVSPQGFGPDWLEEFFGLLDRQPEWLSGVVYGPGVHIDLAELRRRTPQRYPIRHYPDITHTLNCQYPVPDWDTAFARTEGREPINPRPRAYAAIVAEQLPQTIGFLAYSEGVNDDVNKFVWSALAWDPEMPVEEILRDYSRCFLDDGVAAAFTEGLLRLEANWQGALIDNPRVSATLAHFQAIERRASPRVRGNWRFQQALYRATYDACVQARLRHETAITSAVRHALERRSRATPRPPATEALRQTTAALQGIDTESVAPELRRRIFELGDALYRTIRMQMSVKRYHAENEERGATLDTLDTPLTDASWLLAEFQRITSQPGDEAQWEAIGQLLHRTDAGPGGYYDDLGDAARQPHLVRGEGQGDPEFRHTALCAFAFPDEHPASAPLEWKRWASSMYGAPLEMHYRGLDDGARYRLRVVYAGNPRIRMSLEAGGKVVHPLQARPQPQQAQEFAVPPGAVHGGELRLVWRAEAGRGGAGHGCQVAEVMLRMEEAEG